MKAAASGAPAPREFKKVWQKEYQGHKKKIYAIGWNASGTRLATSSSDHTLRVGHRTAPT